VATPPASLLVRAVPVEPAVPRITTAELVVPVTLERRVLVPAAAVLQGRSVRVRVVRQVQRPRPAEEEEAEAMAAHRVPVAPT